MAATFSFSETYGTSPGTTVDSTYVHLLSSNVASGNSTNYQNYPIAIPSAGNTSYSYERWLRGHWTGTFTSISNVKFYKSAGTVPSGDTLNAGDKTDQTYVTPVNTASSYATATIPTTLGTALALGYSSNYCDYVVLQVVMSSSRASGASGSITYKYEWDEV